MDALKKLKKPEEVIKLRGKESEQIQA